MIETLKRCWVLSDMNSESQTGPLRLDHQLARVYVVRGTSAMIFLR